MESVLLWAWEIFDSAVQVAMVLALFRIGNILWGMKD